MQDYQDFIETVLNQAVDKAQSYWGTVTGSVKTGDNNQVLTEADLAVGKLLVEAIEQAYPDYNIIDEEAGVIDKGSNYTWVVDPIDGTSNFASGSPLYGILLGLLDGGTPIAGGIALPAFNEIYTAAKGCGAFLADNRLHVTNETNLLNSLVAYGIDGHQEDPAITYEEVNTLAKIVLGIRNLRSSNSAFDLAQVAKGTYAATLNRTSKIWYSVAPQIIIEEAGGICTDFHGNPINYDNPLNRAEQNFTLCAGPPSLHKQLQAIIHAEKV